MLFEHRVRDGWKEKIPAVVHLDGSARLQTINSKQNPVLFRLLTEYHKRTGVPVLCNTSANRNGSGFFPDMESALGWGRANLVWHQNSLYVKTGFVEALYCTVKNI